MVELTPSKIARPTKHEEAWVEYFVGDRTDLKDFVWRTGAEGTGQVYATGHADTIEEAMEQIRNHAERVRGPKMRSIIYLRRSSETPFHFAARVFKWTPKEPE